LGQRHRLARSLAACGVKALDYRAQKLVLPSDSVIDVKRGFRVPASRTRIVPHQSLSRQCDARTPGEVRDPLPRREHPLLYLVADRQVDIAEERTLERLDGASMVSRCGGVQELGGVALEECADGVTAAD